VVIRWVQSHNQRLRPFSLTGYCPDPNPDELLNQDVKTNAVGQRDPGDVVELMGNVRHHLWSTRWHPAKVQRYFGHSSVCYAV
jgi:hypothetical protein